MKFERTLGLGLLTMLSVAAMAQQPPPPGGPGGMGGPGGPGGPRPTGDFATQKTQILAHIDARAAATATMRNCVSAAANHDALKACRDQEHAAMEAMHPGH